MASNFDEQLLAQQLATAGPQALPLIRRSAYLAEALKSIQDSAARGAIRTPGALGTNLLAEGLAQFGRNRTDKQLQAAQMQDAVARAQAFHDETQGPPPPLSPDGVPQDAPPQQQAQTPAPSPAGPMAFSPPQGDAPSAQMLAAVMKHGYPAPAAAGMVGNLMAESGPNLNRDNPAEGAIGAANWRGPRAQALQAYASQHGGMTLGNQADFMSQELQQPQFAQTNAALMGAKDPQSAAAAMLGYEKPAGWHPGLTDPSGVAGWSNRLGNANTLFAGLQQQPQGAPQPQGQMPQQMAANGPPSTQGPPQGPAPATFQNLPPHVQAQGIAAIPPEELRYVESLLANARTPQQIAQSIQMRDQVLAEAMKRVEYDAHPDPGTGQIYYTPKIPGVGQAYTQNIPGWRSAPPANYTYDAQNNLVPQHVAVPAGPQMFLDQVAGGGRPQGQQAPPQPQAQQPPQMANPWSGGGPQQGQPQQRPYSALPGTGTRQLSPAEMQQWRIAPGQIAMLNEATGTVDIKSSGAASAADLRKEYQGATQQFGDAMDTYARFKAGIAQNNHAGDVAAVQNFLGLAYPSVRNNPAALQQLEESGTLSQRVQAMINNIAGAGGLAPNQRAELAASTEALMPGYREQKQRADAYYSGIAQRAGLNPNDIIEPYDQGDAAPQAPQRAAAPQQPQRLSPQDAAKLPPGTRFIGMDGVERTRH